ncbi:MAG: acyl carrier protein [Pseudonocardiales bacterium]|jgi:acyl carrier protein|nr:acyl carrier protein [Pseudonocardiales bacterium]
MGDSQRVDEILHSFLKRIDKDRDFDRSTPLYADGIGLDSLETAEFSAVLEDEFGRDPFSADVMPQTVGDIADFYDTAVAEA